MLHNRLLIFRSQQHAITEEEEEAEGAGGDGARTHTASLGCSVVFVKPTEFQYYSAKELATPNLPRHDRIGSKVRGNTPKESDKTLALRC